MVASGMGPGGPGGFPGGGFPGGGFPGGGNVRMEDLGDLGGIFGNLFGSGGGGGRRGRRGGGPVGPQRGHDIETELHLDFLEAVHGVTTGVNITSEATCSVCNGSGAKPGTVPDTCGTCGGAGSVAVDQGPFSFSQVCPTCGGRGAIVKDKCKHCKGRGIEVRPRTVKVRIPAGVDDGQRIRVKGRGTPGANGGPAGDLYVIVHVAPHAVFAAQRQVGPHGEGADHLPGGGARRAGEGAHARRARHGEGAAGHAERQDRARPRQGHPARLGRSRRAPRDLRRRGAHAPRRRRTRARRAAG